MLRPCQLHGHAPLEATPQALAQLSSAQSRRAGCLCNCRIGARVCMGLGPAQPKEDREGAIGHRKASSTGTLDTLPTFALAEAPSLGGSRPPR